MPRTLILGHDFFHNKQIWFLPLAVVLLLLGLQLMPQPEQNAFSPQKINLALRRTAHELLRQSGDSTSRIPAVEQLSTVQWRLQFDRTFSYDALPASLQSSLDLHGIKSTYEVTVRRCEDAVIDLGYHQNDFLDNSQVPCGGRAMPEGCHYLEITFLENTKNSAAFSGILAFFTLLIGIPLAFWFFRLRKKPLPKSPISENMVDWLPFGNSRLHVAGQILICGETPHQLTFRETKLLSLFAENLDCLLEREIILQKVWADEGILVGRSVDVFVSRLRKKLAADASLSIVAVHGVGYRMQVI